MGHHTICKPNSVTPFKINIKLHTTVTTVYNDHHSKMQFTDCQ